MWSTNVAFDLKVPSSLSNFHSIICYKWRRLWQPSPVLLPGKSHRQRSLVGCSPWGRKESDMTERLHFQFSVLCIGEGSGNPLQCSCLENPRDGVAQSQTWLKWLSSNKQSRLISPFLTKFQSYFHLFTKYL